MIYRLQLAKIPLCLFIAFSAAFGGAISPAVPDLKTISLAGAIFVLSAGAATLNSLQEYQFDRTMQRTSNRPLAAGLIAPGEALVQAVLFLFAGIFLISICTTALSPVLVALLSVLLYNGIYTPLKRRTLLAIVPGAMCGALPPYIGWLGAGGCFIGYEAALLFSLLFLWQIPHYWLVMLTHQQDYLVTEQPNFLQRISEPNLKRFFVTWIGGLVLVMLLFLLLPLSLSTLTQVFVILNCCSLLLLFVWGLTVDKICNYKKLFLTLNWTLFFHMAIILLGRKGLL